MNLKKIEFDNYRNLSKAQVFFDEDANYIIGDNGIGKTNFLDALGSIFLYHKFRNSDFYDRNFPVCVRFTLRLRNGEESVFSSLEREGEIRLSAVQYFGGDFLLFDENDKAVSFAVLKKVNFILYDDLYKNGSISGNNESVAAVFLKNLVGENYAEQPYANAAEGAAYSLLTCLDVANKNSSDNLSLGCRHNVRVMYTILLSILKAVKNNRGKIVNCILAFDEPEIHLHSFMQRSLIRTVKDISDGKNKDFNRLMNLLFSTEEVNAQLIVVSHSDRIIGKNYKEIIRFYYENGRVAIKSGSTVHLNLAEGEKHLLMRFPYFSEALFSRCVLFAEGECEAGALPVFAEKMGVNLDALCISVVNSASETSMIPLMKLFEKFGINVVGVKDRDVFVYDDAKYDREKRWMKEEKLFLTDGYDFEEEIYESFVDDEALANALREEGINLNAYVSFNAVDKVLKHYRLPKPKKCPSFINYDMVKGDKTLTKIYFLVKLKEMKSITNGESVARSATFIPKVYQRAIALAKEKAIN